MDRANAAIAQPSKTPKTDVARFTITPRDVGTEAVRAGCMAELEDERRVLLVAAKLALQRAKSGHVTLDAISEHALQAAVKVAEAGL